MRPSFALALAVPALLAACAQVPEWHGRTHMQPPADHALTASTAQAPAADWPQDRWWQRYGDAQLNQLIDEALQHAPDMAAAAARVRQAQSVLSVQQAASAPQVGANVSITGDKLSYHHLTPAGMTPRGLNDYGRATLDMDWSLDLWGRQRAAIAAAVGEVQAREAEAAHTRLLLASSVAQAYAELLRLSTTERTLAQSVQVRRTTAELFAKRQTYGLENNGSVAGAQARLAAAQAELVQAQELVTLQRHHIAALLGAAPERGHAITLPDSAQPTPMWAQQWGLPEALPANLLGRRPDVVAARWAVQAMESRVDSQQAAFYPNVNLRAMVGLQSLGLDMLSRGGSSIASVGPAIHLPIFNGGRLRAELGSARAQYDGAVAQYQTTLTRALQEVADNAASQAALKQQLQHMEDAVQAAQTAHRTARNRYEGGLASHLDVLSAEDQLLTNVRQLVQVQARALLLDVALHRALGGGWSSAASAPASTASIHTAPQG